MMLRQAFRPTQEPLRNRSLSGPRAAPELVEGLVEGLVALELCSLAARLCRFPPKGRKNQRDARRVTLATAGTQEGAI